MNWRQFAVDSCTLIRVARSVSQRVEAAAAPSDAAALKSDDGQLGSRLFRRIITPNHTEAWFRAVRVLLHSSALLLSVFLSARDPVLIASAGSHSSHFIRPSWAPSQCFPLSRHQQHLRAVYLHPVFLSFLNCVVSLETEFVLYTCWNSCGENVYYRLLYVEHYFSFNKLNAQVFCFGYTVHWKESDTDFMKVIISFI